MPRVARHKCKYSQIYDDLRHAILRGQYAFGALLPAEVKLAEQYGASRPTVARALSELQQAGLIQRRVGSGTYVTWQDSTQRERMFGLLMPGLGEMEIFEPICSHMARVAEEHAFTLLWGGRSGDASRAMHLQLEQQCQRFIQQKVDGVFFQPLEFDANKDSINTRIASALHKAKIPVVLIDQDLTPPPRRSGLDLVCINNFQSGFIATQHLLTLGCRRIDFVARPFSASTVDLRIAGYHEALLRAGIQPDARWIHWGEPGDPAFVHDQILTSGAEAIICANDATAAALMHQLDECGVKIPTQMRMVGFDDVKYAQLLRVPLTTYRQPLAAMAAMAVHTMLSRIAHPTLPPHTIYLDGELIVRRSTDPAAGKPAPHL
jgi:DNA-binding LacI/PurR family transcriptional regulator